MIKNIGKVASSVPAAASVVDQRDAEIQRLKELLAEKNRKRVSIRTGEKGTVSICGLRRFPIGLYPEELIAILDMSQEIRAYIEANRSALSWKNAA